LRRETRRVQDRPREKVEDLRAEALSRLRALRDRPNGGHLPRYVLQMHTDQKHALVVDSRRSRLYVFENAGGRPRYVADYYVTLGKNGVEKTARRPEDADRRLSRHRQPAAAETDRLLRRRRLPDQLSERLGQESGAQRPRHLAARHALGHL
jgi:hypothetical protein